MPTVSGDQAISWMRGRIPLGSKANVPGSCLNTCWRAYGSHDSIGPHAGQYPNAVDGWNYATKRHPGDMNPPAGFPVFFGVSPTRTDANAKAGDVMVSAGGGFLIGTDVGGAGRIGTISVAARARAISRPYLGWTEDFLGYDVVSTAFSSSDSTPIAPPASTTPEGDDMIRISAPHRGIGVIGPGHYHSLSEEEFQNSDGLVTKTIEGNDRQYDLWVAIATQGQSNIAPFNPTAIAASVSASVAAAITALPSTPGSTPTAAAIALEVEKALLDNFAALPAAIATEESKRLAA